MSTLGRYNGTAFTVTSAGVAVVAPFASVRVLREDSGALASLKNDRAGLVTLSNPMTADAYGRFSFCVVGLAEGFRIRMTEAASPGLEFELRGVMVGTLAELDVPFSAPGDIWVGGVGGAPAVLTVGADGKVAAADSSQAKGLIYIDNPSRPVLNINPDNLLDQINEGALYTVNASDVRGPDGVSGTSVGAGVWKMRTLADPDNAARKVLELTCTTADASLAATDDYFLYRAVEGYDSALLLPGTASPQSVTIQFRLKTSVTGIYGVSIANSALNRRYIGTITVSDTAIHDYTVTLTMDTTGTWLYTNGVGMYMRLCLAAGSNFQSTAGAWAAGAQQTTSAQANFMSNTANIAYLGSVHIIPGPLVQSYQPADIQRHLAKAQRQYEKSYNLGVVPGTSTGAGSVQTAFGAALAGYQEIDVPWKVRKRTTPTVLFWSSTGVANSALQDDASTVAVTVQDAGEWGTRYSLTNTSGRYGNRVHFTSSARLS